MKIFKILIIALFCIGLLFGTSSCATFAHHDNGKHKGWYKNSKKPNYQKTTKHGKAKGKYKKHK